MVAIPLFMPLATLFVHKNVNPLGVDRLASKNTEGVAHVKITGVVIARIGFIVSEMTVTEAEAVQPFSAVVAVTE